jgi:NTP pyrophosphatase (non-canonical NTP hydrolase)
MGNFSNNLYAAELERLALLAEEAGEVIQIVGKILRHGYDSCSPFDETKTTNKELLEKEIGDLQFAIDLMCRCSDVNRRNIKWATDVKETKVQPYLHHQAKEALNTDG